MAIATKKSELYFPELDSLRFFAFLLVLIHHSPYSKLIPSWVTLAKYGWVGVDLFLCLSAFLFARLLFVEYREKGKIHIRYFYLRRALRIWPLYIFFLSAMLVLSVAENGWSAGLIQRAIAMFTFTDNLLTAAIGYNALILYAPHIWTISYEEQFYLVIPWALSKLYQFKHSKTLMILTGVILIGSLVRAVLIAAGVHHPAIWVLPVTHFESIVGGLVVGLGLFDPYLKKFPRWIALAAGLFALYLVTLLPSIGDIGWSLMLTYPLIGIGNSLVLYSVMGGGLGPVSSVLKNKTLGYLGKISYGLYVYHIVGQALAHAIIAPLVSQERELFYPSLALLLSFVITAAFSIVSYQFLERPFLRWKERFAFIRTRPV